MNAVIIVRIITAKKVLKGNSANAWNLSIIPALRLSAIISTARSRQKRIIVPNFKKMIKNSYKHYFDMIIV